MKPADIYTSHQTFDLTECKVHAIKNDDGSTRIVARYPKLWLPFEKRMVSTVAGPKEMRPYIVTEWHEVTLMVIPAG